MGGYLNYKYQQYFSKYVTFKSLYVSTCFQNQNILRIPYITNLFFPHKVQTSAVFLFLTGVWINQGMGCLLLFHSLLSSNAYAHFCILLTSICVCFFFFQYNSFFLVNVSLRWRFKLVQTLQLLVPRRLNMIQPVELF